MLAVQVVYVIFERQTYFELARILQQVDQSLGHAYVVETEEETGVLCGDLQ
jgi:hypothetical protein